MRQLWVPGHVKAPASQPKTPKIETTVKQLQEPWHCHLWIWGAGDMHKFALCRGGGNSVTVDRTDRSAGPRVSNFTTNFTHDEASGESGRYEGPPHPPLATENLYNSSKDRSSRPDLGLVTPVWLVPPMQHIRAVYPSLSLGCSLLTVACPCWCICILYPMCLFQSWIHRAFNQGFEMRG